MIPVFREKFSVHLVGTSFTLRLHGKFKSHPGQKEFLNNMADTKQRMIAFVINQWDCFSAVWVNSFSLQNFILPEHIFRQNLVITSFVVTRKNKLRKKHLMKKMQLLTRKSKSV